MGNFINTQYKDVVSSITDITKDILKNPYYLYSDKKGTSVEYYHINKEKSTLDESARIAYADIGPDCPLRFNLIKDFFIFGLERVQLSLENGEQGLESGDIAGEAIVLPGTIDPYPGDYFAIDHVKDSKWLFRINDVQKDTLDDGANIWKINYKLDRTDDSLLQGLIDEEDHYVMMVNNVGTNYNPIIRSTKYELLEVIDNLCIELKRYFKELFYSSKVQTFIFVHHYLDNFYDPYMIEFLIRNEILRNVDQTDYVYIDHKIPVPKTFSINYNRTFFRSFETRDKKHLSNSYITTSAQYIDNLMSIFHSRVEEYFQLTYTVPHYDTFPIQNMKAHNAIDIFPKIVVDHIMRNEMFTEENSLIYNIFVKYFNDIDFDEEDFDCIERVDYNENYEIFYLVPLLIFCLEYYAKNTLLR